MTTTQPWALQNKAPVTLKSVEHSNNEIRNRELLIELNHAVVINQLQEKKVSQTICTTKNSPQQGRHYQYSWEHTSHQLTTEQDEPVLNPRHDKQS